MEWKCLECGEKQNLDDKALRKGPLIPPCVRCGADHIISLDKPAELFVKPTIGVCGITSRKQKK